MAKQSNPLGVQTPTRVECALLLALSGSTYRTPQDTANRARIDAQTARTLLWKMKARGWVESQEEIRERKYTLYRLSGGGIELKALVNGLVLATKRIDTTVTG